MSWYLDTSAILPILVEETFSRTVLSALQTTEEILIVSEFAAAEVASALSRLARMGALDANAVSAGLAHFDTWRTAFTSDIDLTGADVRLASVFVRHIELGLRAPDAIHAAICRRANHTLVTLDRRLAAAAETLGVRVNRLAETSALHEKPRDFVRG